MSLASQDVEYCLNLLKSGARDIYLASLLLPEEYRGEVFALHAFHLEISNIALLVEEPVAGEIRLQWWREVVGGERPGEAAGNPVARALLQVIERHGLPVSSFIDKLDAHLFDFYHDPMGDRQVFEAWCGETRSCLFQWAGITNGEKSLSNLAVASGHAGVATGVVHILENLARHRSRGRVYVPCDLLSACGLDAAEFMATPGPKHGPVVTGLIDLGYDHLKKSEAAILKLDNSTRPIFKPLALVRPYLKRWESKPLEAYQRQHPLSQLRSQWVLWRY